MKIYNQDKTQELTEVDLTLGYLKDDIIEHFIEEKPHIQEQGHYVTIREYPNGGKAVDWVIDVPCQEYQPAHTEIERILIYIPYTQSELRIQAINRRIAELRQNLLDTDYKVLKYIEEVLSSEFVLNAQEQEFFVQRQAWRKELSDLLGELESLKDE